MEETSLMQKLSLIKHLKLQIDSWLQFIRESIKKSAQVVDAYTIVAYDAINSLDRSGLEIAFIGSFSKRLVDLLSHKHNLVCVNSVDELLGLKKHSKLDVLVVDMNSKCDAEILKIADCAIVFYESFDFEYAKRLPEPDYCDICAYGYLSANFYHIKKATNKLDAFISLSLFLVTVFGSLFYYNLWFPTDDLLRHLIIYKYGYDYSKLYPDAWNFRYNIYLPYDFLYGELHRTFGPEMSIRLSQFFSMFAMMSLILYFNRRSVLTAPIATILILSVLLYLLEGRILGARPTIFVSVFFVLALLTSGWISIFFGLLLSIPYYFWPLYVIVLVVFKREHVITLILATGFWLIYSDFSFFWDLYTFLALNNDIFFPIKINELQSFLPFLLDFPVILIIYLYIILADKKHMPVILFFLILNKVRFIDVIAPILLLSFDPIKIEAFFNKRNLRLLAYSWILIIMVKHFYTLDSSPYEELKSRYYENQKIFADSMITSFRLVFFNNNISIHPSMSYYSMNRDLLEVDYEIHFNGTLNCDTLKRYNYTLLFENSLREFPKCAELKEIYSNLRVWKIKYD